MSWESILKADFSFRDVIKNSRGVYAGIFDRIQITPDLSKLGGAVLGDALKVVEGIDGMTVADKRKAAEVVLMEPMLIGLDMMNDPSMEKDLDNLMEMRVTTISQEKDNKGEESLSPEQINTIEEIANKAAQKVHDEMKQTIKETLQDKFGEELLGAEKQEVMEGLLEVVSSQEFVGYTAVVLNALIIKVAKESEEKATESDFEVEVNPDQAFSEDFMEANKMDWFSQIKR
jgi:membrane-associated HD superfamily phosphohydrolase